MGVNIANENANINSNVPAVVQPIKQLQPVVKKVTKGQFIQKNVCP